MMEMRAFLLLILAMCGCSSASYTPSNLRVDLEDLADILAADPKHDDLVSMLRGAVTDLQGVSEWSDAAFSVLALLEPELRGLLEEELNIENAVHRELVVVLAKRVLRRLEDGLRRRRGRAGELDETVL